MCRLMFLNRNQRLVGMLSLGDLAVIGGDDKLSGHTLEKISEPAEAHERSKPERGQGSRKTEPR